MVFINEWLPNPAGADSSGEWVELWNSGASAVDISRWQLKTKAGSKAVLSGELDSGRYIVLPRTKTKLVLKNSDESLSLYDSQGKLVAQSSFFGSAQEGKSFSRSSGGSFAWADPTPGAENKITLVPSATKSSYSLGANISGAIAGKDIVLLALGAALVFAAIAVFILKKNEDLSKLFFGGN